MRHGPGLEQLPDVGRLHAHRMPAAVGAALAAISALAVAAAIAAVATIVLPLPVGVVNKTLLPSTSSRMASSCASYSSTPLTSIDH